MGLNKKPYIEQDKQTAENKLAARVEWLKGKGMEETGIQREVIVKKLKAEIRQARKRLNSIAAQEKLTQDLAAMKLQKEQDAKAAKEAPPAKSAKAPKAEKAPAKKSKKEKKQSAE